MIKEVSVLALCGLIFKASAMAHGGQQLSLSAPVVNELSSQFWLTVLDNMKVSAMAHIGKTIKVSLSYMIKVSVLPLYILIIKEFISAHCGKGLLGEKIKMIVQGGK